MTLKLTLALVMAFITAVIVGKFYVPWLRKMKAGQEIKENGPTWHMSKSGTPTMGGVIFISACTLVCLTVGFESMRSGDFTHIFVLLFALVFGAIGFLDDWEKLRKKQNLGLSAKAKFLLQLVAALVFVLLLRKMGYISTKLYIPFWNIEVYIPEVIYFILAAFIIVGTVNAVNITDGVDGLASGTSIPVCLFFAAVSFLWGDKYMALGIFASALLGGLMGFLVYNFNPAKVFMGDTGSMFLGGMVTALAFIMGRPELVFFFGIVYIWDAMTVVIQRVYFKLTHGKRIFRMTPIHHAFEMRGWKEVKIDFFFSLIAIIGVVLGLMYVYMA